MSTIGRRRRVSANSVCDYLPVKADFSSPNVRVDTMCNLLCASDHVRDGHNPSSMHTSACSTIHCAMSPDATVMLASRSATSQGK